MSGAAQMLLERLREFDIGGPKQVEFLRRLMRHEGWDIDRAVRVVDEYRKFLVLKVLHDGEVSPSKAVDSVWHLHLTYTQDYWERLCRDTLGRALHHEPMTVTSDEARRRIAATLAYYREEFGIDPPFGIWDDPKRHRPGRLQAVLRLTFATASLFLGSLILSYWCADLFRPNEDAVLPLFLGSTIALVVVRYVVLHRWMARHMRPLGDLAEFSIFDFACLLRGRVHATFTTVVSLLLHDNVRLIYPRTIEFTAAVPAGASAWERRAARALAHGPLDVKDLDIVLAQEMIAAEARAVAAGLTPPESVAAKAVRVSYPIFAAAPVGLWLAWRSTATATGANLTGPLIVSELVILMTIWPLHSSRIRNLRASLANRFARLNPDRSGGLLGYLPVGERVIAVGLFGGLALKGTSLWDSAAEFNRDREKEQESGCG